MLFKFLRHYFIDIEFEQTKEQLTESVTLLKKMRQDFRQKERDEREKVDAGFLALMWATIAFAATAFFDTGNEAIELYTHPLSIEFYVFGGLATFALFFIIYNSWWAIGLTIKHSKQKEDKRYTFYAWSIVIGAALLIIAILVLASFSKNI